MWSQERFWRFVRENRDWLFSGLGVLIVATLVSFFGGSLAWLYDHFVYRRFVDTHSEGLALAHFTLDNPQQCSQMFRYNPNKLDTLPRLKAKIIGDGPVIIENIDPLIKDGITLLYIGQKFPSLCYFDLYISSFTNHELFRALSDFGYSPTDALVIDDPQPCGPSAKPMSCGMVDQYPRFLISISNNSDTQVIGTQIVVAIKEVIYVSAAGESERLDPIADYIVAISDSMGQYEVDLSPPFKIAAHDSVSISVQIVPREMSDYPTGKLVIGSIIVVFDNYKIETPNFLFLFMN